MEWDDFEYIIQYCIFFGISPSKLSFQFHVCSKNRPMVKKMIHYALYMGICKFDVSTYPEYIPSRTLENVSYEFFIVRSQIT